jgi:hypothetical protein
LVKGTFQPDLEARVIRLRRPKIDRAASEGEQFKQPWAAVVAMWLFCVRAAEKASILKR